MGSPHLLLPDLASGQALRMPAPPPLIHRFVRVYSQPVLGTSMVPIRVCFCGVTIVVRSWVFTILVTLFDNLALPVL